ncbi:hypothetical protein SISNIDRAFT_491139 [Sistotremastrum niveocremeum HHB9708]|uniref:MYND-type domain-containing protein n=1 Tax=Sistotremastrum niveocremeum HHB9708 TaxID=1314777 RepID=A0A164N5J9_9AGAM|nr:hypothetical protein SISNIDRAFT_491139 [Sistotremastrum niveocremeum HHB9708]
MSRLYTENEKNDYIVNEVIGHIGNMCIDAVLRNKIYRDGWLPRILQALERPRIRQYSPLPVLQTFLMHPSPELFKDLCTNVIPRLSRHLLNPTLRSEDVGSTINTLSVLLANATNFVSLSGLSFVLKENKLEPAKIVNLLMDRMSSSRTKESDLFKTTCFEISMIVSLTQIFPDVASSTPRLLSCFVACLRSDSCKVRASAMHGLLKAWSAKFGPPSSFNVEDLMRGYFGGLNSEIASRLNVYGKERTYGFQCLSCLNSLSAVVGSEVAALEFFRIGLDMANVTPGMDHYVLSQPFRWKSLEYPFDTWAEALPHMADILRSHSEFDSADILDLKYILHCGKLAAVRELAENAAQRTPEVGFWYYALALTATGTNGDILRQIREHLQNRHLSSEQRFYVLYKYSSLALHFIADELRSTRPAEPMWEEALSRLAFWYENLKAAVNDAAPDTPHLNFLSTIQRSEPEFSILSTSSSFLIVPTPKLRSIVRHYDLIMTIHEFLTNKKASDSLPSVERMVERFFLDNIVSGTSNWKSLIIRTNSCVWAEEERGGTPLGPSGLGMKFFDASPNASFVKTTVLDATSRRRMHLYNCSWCLNPSAVMRKCAVCGSARYCDKECQKRDWKAHKKVCKSQEITI